MAQRWGRFFYRHQLEQSAEIVANQLPAPMVKPDAVSIRRLRLAFYPDRVLAFRANSVGAIDYERLNVASEPTQFIEHEAVPADATVVGHTWQYVNKNGTPDTRFKNNRQIPVCRYNQMNLSTPGGLDMRLQGSRDGAFDSLAQAVTSMRMQRVAAGVAATRPRRAI